MIGVAIVALNFAAMRVLSRPLRGLLLVGAWIRELPLAQRFHFLESIEKSHRRRRSQRPIPHGCLAIRERLPLWRLDDIRTS
jgi:hypothetical protein